MLLAWPGFEPMNSRSEVHHANHYTIEASYKKGQIFHVEYYNVLLFCEVKIEMPVTYNEWILECPRLSARGGRGSKIVEHHLWICNR